MAKNQTVILMLPNEFISRPSFSIDNLFDGEGYNDSSLAWKSQSNVEEVIASIDRYFVRGKSWNEEIMLWGRESESDIALIKEDGRITDLVVRIDTSKGIDDWLDKTNKLAEEISCTFFLPKSKLIFRPYADGLKLAIIENKQE